MWRRTNWLGVRTWYLAAAAIALFAAIFGGRTLWRAQAVLHEAGDRVAAESSLRFTATPIETVLPIGLESVGAPATFVDARVFHGRLFIAGPGGLAEYDSSAILAGGIVARYRVGVELRRRPSPRSPSGWPEIRALPNCGSRPRAKGWSLLTAGAFARFARKTPGFAKLRRCSPSKADAF